jgi:hypothetical protein
MCKVAGHKMFGMPLLCAALVHLLGNISATCGIDPQRVMWSLFCSYLEPALFKSCAHSGATDHASTTLETPK